MDKNKCLNGWAFRWAEKQAQKGSDACFLHNVGRNILYLYQNKAFSENREIGT